VIFNMVATAILDFQKFEILTVFPVQGANLRHRAKCHQNGLDSSGEMERPGAGV